MRLRMKIKWQGVLIACALTLCAQPGPPASAAAPAPAVDAGGAVLLEMNTGRVLFAKDMDRKLPMASTTKIMTALLAVEAGNLQQMVTVPDTARVEGSSMYLMPGETVTMENLLYGLMLASGNDAAVTIATRLAGSVPAFAEMMNRRAREIGALNTNFVTPNGLHDGNHYTTAYDLGLIAATAMQNPEFRNIVSTKYKTIPWEGHPWDRVFKNKNKILWQYEGGNGVKTGFTKNAGRCLVAAAERGNMELIAVVLNCGEMFTDCMDMLDYGFATYKPETMFKAGETIAEIPVREGMKDSLSLKAPRDIVLPLQEGELARVEKRVAKPELLQAPVQQGQSVGSIEYSLDGRILFSAELKSEEFIELTDYRYYLERILRGFNAKQAG